MRKENEMKDSYYKQCRLTKDKTSEIVYLPENLAVLNKIVEVHGEDGWRVTSVGMQRVKESYLQDHERDYLKQREASDI